MEKPSIVIGKRASGYPKGTYIDGQYSVVDRWYAEESQLDSGVIESNIQQLTYLKMSVVKVDWSYNEPGSIAYIDVTYGVPSQSGGSPSQNGRTEWYLDDGGQEIPIDKRKNDGSLLFPGYRTCHNHILLGSAGAAVPSWWETATTTVTPDDNYRWVRDIGAASSGEVVVADKTRNIESVLAPAPVVVGIVKYGQYGTAAGQAKPVGTKQTPAKTFGFTGEWLVVGCSIAKDGRRWAVTTRYQNAAEWDASYYA
jgi:hypothetical protein